MSKQVKCKQFCYGSKCAKPFNEAAEFASTLDDRLITITGHGDVYSNQFACYGRVVVWYYEQDVVKTEMITEE